MQPCGTRAAYIRHRRNGEKPCEPCAQAERDYQRARYQPTTPRLRTCARCASTLPTTRHKYCSDACAHQAFLASEAYAKAQAKRNSAARPKKPRSCLSCGTAWLVDPHSPSKYCSSSCIPRPPKKPKAPPKARPEPKPRFSHVRFPTCSVCNEIFCTRYTVSTCSEACKKIKAAIDRGNAKHRRRSLQRSAYIEPVHWRMLFREDGPACHLCGFETNPDDYTVTVGSDGRRLFLAGLEYPTVDHIVPLSRGGDHSRENALLAHMYCNSIKGAHSLESVA